MTAEREALANRLFALGECPHGGSPQHRGCGCPGATTEVVVAEEHTAAAIAEATSTLRQERDAALARAERWEEAARYLYACVHESWASRPIEVSMDECDPLAREVLRLHWPGVNRDESDVKITHAADLAPVELMCGGFPCQDLSAANRRGRELPTLTSRDHRSGQARNATKGSNPGRGGLCLSLRWCTTHPLPRKQRRPPVRRGDRDGDRGIDDVSNAASHLPLGLS